MTGEEIAAIWGRDWFVETAIWVGKLMDVSIDALPEITVAYSYDNDTGQWAEQPWTIPGEEPTLQGYNGGSLVIQSSADPRPTGLPTAGLLVKEVPGQFFIIGCNINANKTAPPVHEPIGCDPLAHAPLIHDTRSNTGQGGVIMDLYIQDERRWPS